MVDTLTHDSMKSVHTSDAAHKRLKRRYAAERRFKAMGFCAVIAATSFLFFLLGSILWDAMPAFQQHYMILEVPLKAEQIDPDGTREFDNLANANYPGLIKKELRNQFLHVKGRKDKRALAKLVSSNAASRLQGEVLENPNIIGTNHKIEVLTSDHADLYLKGLVTSKSTIETNGIASPVGTIGEIKILSTSNDFANILAKIKQNLKLKARDLRDEIAGLNRSLKYFNTQISDLESRITQTDGATKKQLENKISQLTLDVESVTNQRRILSTKLKDLETRASSINQPEQLSRDIPSILINLNGGVVKVTKVSAAEITGQAILPLKSEQDVKATDWQIIEVSPPEASRKLTDKEIVWLDKLRDDGQIIKQFNTQFFTAGASREAEVAGIWGAVVGTFFTMLVTMLLSFPIGVAAAIYLEEFAPRNKITDFIEVNINNLAAVPSIVFGLLGLAMFLNVFGLPRSAPLVGGMVLALMTLPTIIIASRAALKAVPPSISEAALGLGASHMQAVFHHNLPLAMPGILTGSIIGMAQALGETAPLLMIGMVAFIVDIPGSAGFMGGFTDPATVLPVQIYMWADFPEVAFRQKTAAAIIVLLGFLIAMNALAIILRKKFERRW